MQVLNPNDVKIYNLTHGKSIPDWLSDRKKRLLLKSDVGLQKRIQLMQEFEMPISSQKIAITPDKTHIYVSGVYPPRLRCFDTKQLSMKFERGLDHEVVAFHILSDDWKKIVLLQSDRHIEFQTQDGIYYKTRIPTFGRDLCYYTRAAELFIGATGPQVYRLNLCKGTFMNPIETLSTGVNVTHIHPQHSLLMFGTDSGTVECWDPRSRSRCATLTVPDTKNITCIQSNKTLELGVGTESGQVILYDIRSTKPILSKDHYYEKPINSIHFYNSDSDNYVISACSKSFKVWHKDSGKPFTAIESDEDICDVAWYEGSGMFFFANEGQKMKTYFIPSLGPAPKWCWFLDNLTEELEESTENVVYDDYKFVTKEELESLGLSHLIGTNYLRAYMHGFFVDMKLYREVKQIVNPFAFEEYKKGVVDKKLQSQMKDRVEVKKLPKINKSLAMKDMHKGSKLLEDDRFGLLFSNPDFQVDEESEQFKLINPTVRKHESKSSEFTLYNAPSDAEDSEAEESAAKLKKVKRKRQMKLVSLENESVIYSKKSSVTTSIPLGQRLSENTGAITSSAQLFGAREMKVEMEPEKTTNKSKRTEEMKQHQTERRQLGRSASGLMRKQRGKFWRGRKVG